MLALADTGATLTVMPGALLHRLEVQRLRRVSAVLAEVGFAVTGYDTSDDFVTRVNTTWDAGFREEGLDELLATHLHETLTLTSSPPASQDVYIITVGTPLEPSTQRPGLDRIRVAVQRIAAGFGQDPLVILRSTVSFANEVALIAERMGLSAGELIHAANVDYPRSHVAQPGFVGGPCLEKDALSLIDSLKKIDFNQRVIEEAREINQVMPDHVAARSSGSSAASAAHRPAPRCSSPASPSRAARPPKTSAARAPSRSCAGSSPPASRSGGTTS
jgi:UDP-N-acetyl-D-mannosaminuronate dehydrogenase